MNSFISWRFSPKLHVFRQGTQSYPRPTGPSRWKFSDDFCCGMIRWIHGYFPKRYTATLENLRNTYTQRYILYIYTRRTLGSPSVYMHVFCFFLGGVWGGWVGGCDNVLSRAFFLAANMTLSVCFQGGNATLSICFQGGNATLSICFQGGNATLSLCFQGGNATLSLCFQGGNATLSICFQGGNATLSVCFQGGNATLSVCFQGGNATLSICFQGGNATLSVGFQGGNATLSICFQGGNATLSVCFQGGNATLSVCFQGGNATLSVCFQGGNATLSVSFQGGNATLSICFQGGNATLSICFQGGNATLSVCFQGGNATLSVCFQGEMHSVIRVSIFRVEMPRYRYVFNVFMLRILSICFRVKCYVSDKGATLSLRYRYVFRVEMLRYIVGFQGGNATYRYVSKCITISVCFQGGKCHVIGMFSGWKCFHGWRYVFMKCYYVMPRYRYVFDNISLCIFRVKCYVIDMFSGWKCYVMLSKCHINNRVFSLGNATLSMLR